MTVSQSQGQIKRDLLSNTRVSVEFSLIYILGLIGWKCPVPDFLDFLLVERTWGYISQLMFEVPFRLFLVCALFYLVNDKSFGGFFLQKKDIFKHLFSIVLWPNGFWVWTNFAKPGVRESVLCDLWARLALSLFFTLIIGDWLHLCIEFLPFKFSQDLVRYGEFLQ